MPRPTGVTILGILGVIGGGFAILLAVFLLLGSNFLANRAPGLPGVLIGLGGTLLGVFIAGLGALYLVAGIGLLALKEWARILTMVVAGIGLIFAALAVMGGLVHFLIVLAFRRLIAGAIDVLILWYLAQPDVKRAFAPRGSISTPVQPTGSSAV